MSKSILVIVLAALLLTPAGAQQFDEFVPHAAAVRRNYSFLSDLYVEIRKTEDGNIFFSPTSLYNLIALAYGGAGTSTAEQIAVLLHVDGTDEEFHTQTAALIEDLRDTGPNGPELTLAGALWPLVDYRILPDFLDLAARYGSTVQPLDYASDPAGAQRAINKWGEEQTRGLIKEILPEPGTITKKARFNMGNAIYFRGFWEMKFDERDTEDRPFTRVDGSTVSTPMMEQLQWFFIEWFDGYRIGVLPYLGERYVMAIVLPDKPEGIRELDENLTTDNLSLWSETIRNEQRTMPVHLLLPRFTLQWGFDATRAMMNLGAVDAFTPIVANFSGIDGKIDNLVAEWILHQAYIEVDEEGTKAAAISLGGGGCFLPGTPVTLAAGNRIPIEQVASGVQIQTVQPDTGGVVSGSVSAVESSTYRGDLITITVADSVEETIEATGNHPFYVLRGTDLASRPRPTDLSPHEPVSFAAGRWVEARHLKPGDILRSLYAGSEPRVTAVVSREGERQVFNLRIADFETYTVGTQGLLVHNKASAGEDVEEFYADHPFLYFIMDRRTGAVLFMGRMMDPSRN